MSKLRIAVASAILALALVATGQVQAHRLHHHAFPHDSKLAFFQAKQKWLRLDKHHVDVIRWRERRIVRILSDKRHSISTVPNLGAAIRWHRARWHRHDAWFHLDRRALRWITKRIVHLKAVSTALSGWNSSDLGLIPGVPYSFAACVALRESTNGQGSSDIYGILPVSTWGNVSLAAQKHQFAHLYALYGASPWRPYDGC